MKNGKVISIVALGVLIASLAGFGSYRMFRANATGYYPGAGAGSDPDPVMRAIFGRKSVRHFTGEKVPRETLGLLVKAGMAAPSALNRQPWAFVVVTERAVLDRLANSLPYAKMLLQAGAAIVVCGVTDGSEYWVMDCSAASQNILLAAEAMGLGAVWTAAYPSAERIAGVRGILGMPDGIIPLNVIPVGYPTGEDTAKDKFKAENVHWEKW